ncbi:hypothetical protein B0G75_104263 [Paraburkholderia sp. BL18I3N2]|uniref:hypothetical protein n=1 Tax=Paraburkholderia sp. BL18I3N2 TaxID=1938799 RepID=UPI000D05EA46|nr:hypothetical protein [Paraburkholderia sp. BL18I3N2]PRX32242.1 hypothetical protein B0G75_104263 [Paraburkholderia sp. BL18I3N2]
MATYNRTEATERAIEIARLAVQAGVLHPVAVDNRSNPEESGKNAAAWLGGFVAELAGRIEKL